MAPNRRAPVSTSRGVSPSCPPASPPPSFRNLRAHLPPCALVYSAPRTPVRPPSVEICCCSPHISLGLPYPSLRFLVSAVSSLFALSTTLCMPGISACYPPVARLPLCLQWPLSFRVLCCLSSKQAHTRAGAREPSSLKCATLSSRKTTSPKPWQRISARCAVTHARVCPCPRISGLPLVIGVTGRFRL